MKIELSDYKGEKVIALSGDIDMHSSPGIRNELLKLTGNKTCSILVDFSEVSYIDSSGIATFVEALKAMKLYDGRLKLTCLPEDIMEIFRFSKLDSVFEIHRDIEDAIRS